MCSSGLTDLCILGHGVPSPCIIELVRFAREAGKTYLHSLFLLQGSWLTLETSLGVPGADFEDAIFC